MDYPFAWTTHYGLFRHYQPWEHFSQPPPTGPCQKCGNLDHQRVDCPYSVGIDNIYIGQPDGEFGHFRILGVNERRQEADREYGRVHRRRRRKARVDDPGYVYDRRPRADVHNRGVLRQGQWLATLASVHAATEAPRS
jgi:hypothetical protein